MTPKVTAGITGAAGGALIGALTGYLIDKGKGAGYGAAVGGVALGFVGVVTASPGSSGTGAAGFPRLFGFGATPDRPRMAVRAGSINPQLRPR